MNLKICKLILIKGGWHNALDFFDFEEQNVRPPFGRI